MGLAPSSCAKTERVRPYFAATSRPRALHVCMPYPHKNSLNFINYVGKGLSYQEQVSCPSCSLWETSACAYILYGWLKLVACHFTHSGFISWPIYYRGKQMRQENELWLVTVPLIYFDVVVWHQSNQIMRQLGLQHTMPQSYDKCDTTQGGQAWTCIPLGLYVVPCTSSHYWSHYVSHGYRDCQNENRHPYSWQTRNEGKRHMF